VSRDADSSGSGDLTQAAGAATHAAATHAATHPVTGPATAAPVPRVVAPVTAPNVTLVEGSSFCVSAHSGDIDPGRAEGLFVRDTRIVSRWSLLVDGEPIEPLAVIPSEPFEAMFLGRAASRDGHTEPTLEVERRRMVGQGMREDILLRNFGPETAGVELRFLLDADFADLFEVKAGRRTARRSVGHRMVGGDIVYWLEGGDQGRGVRISAPGAVASSGMLCLTAIVPARGSWSATVEVLPSVAGQEFEASFPLGTAVESSRPARRMRGWRASTPAITVDDPALAEAIRRSQEDLGALRIVDPDHPDDDVVAAGAPWYMALFGRDSLLTSWMTLPFSPAVAMGTLRTLARLQGRRTDLMTEEQPGRILHEVRLGAALSLALGGDSVYYGSIDSTPLFVMLVGQAARWGVPWAEVGPLLPAVDAALAWIDDHGDRDGDGFVEYCRATDRGLLNQGWKDSHDAIAFADGRRAHGPIALAEVQGYCYAAFLARAELSARAGDTDGQRHWEDRAAQLKSRFHEAFWMPDRKCYALALDGDKRQVDVVSSNIGHCLWTGIVEDAVAPKIVEHLLSPAMFTGFGIRTLSSEAAAYNPVSYHNGSVWPHDTVLAASGIARYGFRTEATRVTDALLDAARAFSGRLPELFCGFDRTDKPVPVPYPTSCSPQAWAAAVPFEILRINLGLTPGPGGSGLTATTPTQRIKQVSIEGIRVGEDQHNVRGGANGVVVT
jgi:glycogen debranching enzyme